MLPEVPGALERLTGDGIQLEGFCGELAGHEVVIKVLRQELFGMFTDVSWQGFVDGGLIDMDPDYETVLLNLLRRCRPG